MTECATTEQGVVFNIQRFSLHDGPGIRTIVFFKGCPLRCKWCSNPESWRHQRELMFDSKKCIQCQKCLSLCPANALTEQAGKVKLASAKCNDCLKCVAVCPTEALTVAGTVTTVQEVLTEVEKDSLFYVNSGGGVTASGGEPLLQPRFLHDLFKACKDKAISTALETCGYAPRETLESVLEHTDLALFDVKLMNSEAHRKWTGVGNELILGNAEYTASKVKTWLRFPLIPTVNDSEENLMETAQFAAKIGVEKISVLPYHSWGAGKYRRLGMRYVLAKLESPSDARVAEVKAILEESGKEVTVGW